MSGISLIISKTDDLGRSKTEIVRINNKRLAEALRAPGEIVTEIIGFEVARDRSVTRRTLDAQSSLDSYLQGKEF